jgi:hypothetical protein
MSYVDNKNPLPLPSLGEDSPPDIRFKLQVAQYVVVACLMVSLL